MKKNFTQLMVSVLLLIFGLGAGIILRHNKTTWAVIEKPFSNAFVKFDDTRKTDWDKEFNVVEIKSKLDDSIQKAYFYKSKANKAISY